MSPRPSPSLPATVDASELAGRLRLSVTRLARQLRQTAGTDLSPTQGAVLATISNHGPLTLGELAERERVAGPTITKVIGVLHARDLVRSEEHTSELQSLMRISYAVFCLK